jgi:hypothetical protein
MLKFGFLHFCKVEGDHDATATELRYRERIEPRLLCLLRAAPRTLYPSCNTRERERAAVVVVVVVVNLSFGNMQMVVQSKLVQEQECSWPPTLTAPAAAPPEFFISSALQPQQQHQKQPFISPSTDYTSSFAFGRNKRRFCNAVSKRRRTTFLFRSSLEFIRVALLCRTVFLPASASETMLQGQLRRIRHALDDSATIITTPTTRTAAGGDAVESSSSATVPLSSALRFHTSTIRGGSMDPTDTSTAAAADVPDNSYNKQKENVEDSGQTNDDQEQPQVNSNSINKFWPARELFRLYDTVKGEALSLEQELRGPQRPPRNDDDEHIVDEDNDSLNTRGRGGAAVAVAARQQQEQQQQQQAIKRFQWFGSSSEPFENTAPLSPRLLHEDEEKDEPTDENQQQQQDQWQQVEQHQQQQGRPAVSRWGNVGMQFVPDGVQDSELDFLDDEEEDDDDEDKEDDGNDDEEEISTSSSSSSRRKDRSATTKMSENDQALMQAISHLKPEGYGDDSRQLERQQRQAPTTVLSVAEAIDEREKEKYIKGAHMVTELPHLADAALTKEQEAALSLFSDSCASTDETNTTSSSSTSLYASSGIWPMIDIVLTAGYAYSHPAWKLSPKLRPIRKVAARVTGMHGVLSGKQRMIQQQEQLTASKQAAANHYKHLDMVKRRLAAIDRARRNLHRVEGGSRRKRSPIFGGWFQHSSHSHQDDIHYAFVFENTDIEETQRRRRVQEIDKLMADGQRHLLQLATEKDVLQRRPNPLWTYKTTLEELDEARRVEAAMHHNYSTTHGETVVPTRLFTFPPKDLVDDYLELLFMNERLVKMNHTELWRNDATSNSDDFDHDEDYCDADEEDEWFFGASSLSSSKKSRSRNRRQQRGRTQQQRRSDAKNDGHYYYGPANRATYSSKNNINNNNNNDDAGSFWLRNGLGEKIGDAVETAAYKAVCQAVMSFLARLLSSLHGINVMGYSDIRLFAEEAPEFPDSDTDEFRRARRDAFSAAMRRGAKSSNKKRRKRAASTVSDFMQRDAVVETLLSQSQIAAPLLKVFPLNWQRALLGNIVTLVTCVMADFVEGLEFQILGHRLSFAFAPITEEDMIRHLHMVGTMSHGSNNLFYHRRYKSKDGTNDNHSPERFEEAVRATARDLSLELNFLDKWHERALGGEMLKTQIATLIARLVLSLVDEILCGARMDLWTTHAGGPRLVAGLEYRRNNTAATIPGATTKTTTMTTTAAATTTTSTSSLSSR